MKNIYFTLLLMCISTFAMKANGIPERNPDGPVFTFQVEIGKRPDCIIAWAICRVTVGGAGMTSTLESPSTPSAGNGGGGGGGGSWLWRIPKKNLAAHYPQFLSRLEGKSTVTFDEGFLFPPEYAKALGTTKELMIKANQAYPLRFENDEFVITFPL